MKPKLPNYSDDEVKCFHPVFKYCADEAIKLLNLEDELVVVHHRSFNGITVDYSIENKVTKKISLLVEIKRTVSAVESTRYRHQALSYRKEADHLCQSKYYILTNLEQTDLFKYDSNRPRVSSQVVKGSPFIAGSFINTNQEVFLQNLVVIISKILVITAKDSGDYDDSLDILYSYLSTKVNDEIEWHKFLMPFSYEYIRGSSSNYPNLNEQVQNIRWKAADSYIDQPKRLSEKGSAIDFKMVFRDPIPNAKDNDAFNNILLNTAFVNGKNRGKAEDISEVVYELISPKGQGIVETDEELARLLSIVAKDTLGRSLDDKELISDPAAGSGRLITSAVNTCFSEVSAKNIWANEIETLFSEALSIRIGLCFAETISFKNSPKITLSDISDLSQEEFINSKVILLNPPYISGIYSKSQRTNISKSIERINNSASVTNKGQIGLECPFLELVHSLAQDDSVIAAIMPFSILTRGSEEFSNFRKFLIESFGLSTIVTYPRHGLFESVNKRTCILVGRKGYSSEKIKWLNLNVSIDRINLNDLQKSLKSLEDDRTFTISEYKKEDLLLSVKNGWMSDTKKIANKWFDGLIGKECSSLEGYRVKRGTSGNSGSSDLSAISKKKFPNLIESIPLDRRLSAINNSDGMEKILTGLNSPCISVIMEDTDSLEEHPLFLSEIINSYMKEKEDGKNTQKQKKATISYEKVFNSLKKDVTKFSKYSILLPRAIRVSGVVGVTLSEYNISTNFIVISFESEAQAVILASWFFSIFGQIQMEFLANDQEGVRKLEKSEINKLRIPMNVGSIDDNMYYEIKNSFIRSEPINFKNIRIREIDEVWAKLISDNPDKILSEAYSAISDLVDERSP